MNLLNLFSPNQGRHAIVGLSDPERRVASHVAEGLTNQEIANKLHRSLDTISTHVKRVMAKLNAKNRAHIVAIAIRNGDI